MKITKKTLLWGLAGIAAIGALGWAFAPRPLQVEVAPVTEGVFEQSIEEDGQTRVKDRYTISAPVAARIARTSLHEGDTVAAGDIVAVLTPTMSSMVDERSAREAAARLRAATAAITMASARVARASVALQEARLELQRSEKLAGDGFISSAKLDSARLAVTAATRELDAADAQRQVAVQERAAAEVVLQPVTSGGPVGIRPYPVRSPVSGLVLRIPVQSEATIAPGAALVDVGDPSQMEVVAELLTADAVQARPGTPVVIERWGGPPVQGRVRLVEPSGFTKVSALGIEEQRVKVLIDIVDPPAAWQSLGDGFRVTVRVITQRVEHARLVPVGALFPHQNGFASYVVEGSHARLVPVVLRGRNAGFGWVEGGPPVGARVIVYPPANVADGSRVKIRTP